MSPQLKETDKIAIDPFGVRYSGDSGVDLSSPYVDSWELELDPSTGSTHAVKGDCIDFVAQIQTFKDQCGIEAMTRDIAAGRALPSDYADDGAHGGDFTRSTMISEYVGQLVAAEMAAQKAAADSEGKGIETKEILADGADIEAIVTRLVNERMAANNANIANNAKGEDSK